MPQVLITKAHRAKHGKCPTCGKRVAKRRTFTLEYELTNGASSLEAVQKKATNQIQAEADAWKPDFQHHPECP